MRIGHQLYEFLQDWTDTSSYCIQVISYFSDNEGKRLCIKQMYINDGENQVYLILEDENQIPFHTSVHDFITMMGGPRPENYAPLYQIRDEVKKIKRNKVKRYKQAQRDSNIKRLKLVNDISDN